MKTLIHLVEFLMLKALFAFLRLLPLDVASSLGGELALLIGPFLKAQKIAKKNLAMVFPEWSEEKRRTTLAAMWNNLGRVVAEFSHLSNNSLLERVKIEGVENLPPAGQPVIFVSGHIGNWELSYPVVYERGIPIALFYRQANNPYVDKFITAIRSLHSTRTFSKGKRGAAGMTKAIKNGESLAIMIDQKMNDGIAVPFFGRDAMTAPIPAVLALRYNLPIIPARVIRTEGANFIGTAYPPIEYERTGDNAKDTLAIMTKINQVMESWVREHPEQWFWVHQRWPKS